MADYLRVRRGYYYLRFRVPVDLSSLFPTEKEFLKALHTKDKKLALQCSSRLVSQSLEVFTLYRCGFLSEDHVTERLGAILERKPKAVPQSPLALPTSPAAPTLRTVIAQYVKDNKSSWSGHTFTEYESCFRLINDLLGDMRITEIDRDTVRDFRETLSKLPANAQKKYPGKTIQELLAITGVPTMSFTTVNKRLRILGSIMRHSIKEKFISVNPVEGLKVQQNRRTDEERKAYSREDLKTIQRCLPTDRLERLWIPLISMYSGMRLGEACGLHVEDINQIEGVWCFDLNEEDEKRLKTPSSVRIIPVHPKLIERGFLDLVEAMRKKQQKRLWPNLQRRESDGYCSALGNWFQRFNREEITDDPRKSFHSMRHSFADTLKQLGVQESLIAELMGHANSSITTGRYGKRYQPSRLLEAVSMISY